MKSLTNKLMVAAAAIAAVAGVASAQSMSVEVPFSFQVGGTTMPAGTYKVAPIRNDTGVPPIKLQNTETHQPVLVLPMSAHDGATQYSEAKLVFSCSNGNCSLAQIWTGTYVGAFDLRTPKSSRQEASLIAIPATKAD